MLDVSWLDAPSVTETISEEGWSTLHNKIRTISPRSARVFRRHTPYSKKGCAAAWQEASDLSSLATPEYSLSFSVITEHRELAAMVHAGMPEHRAIQAATQDGAALLGMPDRGTVAPGKRADLLVLHDDPLQDIRNTLNISAVYLGGRPVRDEMESDGPCSPRASTALLDGILRTTSNAHSTGRLLQGGAWDRQTGG